jgi:phospholipid transport system substrate-binding protein
MTDNLRPFVTLAALLVGFGAFAASPKDEVSKPLKTVVQSVRFGKDQAALKNFAGEEQGKLLLADEWAKGTDEQRKEFVTLFHTLFAKIAFPKIRKNFENLDTVLYEEPAITGDKAEIGSTILINHPLKKQELKVKYKLVKDKGAWKVIDVSVLGDSMLKGIREDQIVPIMQKGGWDNLLKLMRERAKELESVPLK